MGTGQSTGSSGIIITSMPDVASCACYLSLFVAIDYLMAIDHTSYRDVATYALPYLAAAHHMAANKLPRHQHTRPLGHPHFSHRLHPVSPYLWDPWRAECLPRPNRRRASLGLRVTFRHPFVRPPACLNRTNESRYHTRLGRYPLVAKLRAVVVTLQHCSNTRAG